MNLKRGGGETDQNTQYISLPLFVVSAMIEWLGETNDRLKREAEEEAQRIKERKQTFVYKITQNIQFL